MMVCITDVSTCLTLQYPVIKSNSHLSDVVEGTWLTSLSFFNLGNLSGPDPHH